MNTLPTNSYYLASQMMEKSIVSLINILGKAAEHVLVNKLDETEFINARLAPDMFPLARQIQIASDNAKGYVSRMTATTNVPMDDTEDSIHQLVVRLQKTLEIVRRHPESDYANAGSVQVVLPWMAAAMPGKSLSAATYLADFALPNFYFHVVTAYGIMRHQGIQVGKMDYIGQLDLQDLA